MATAYRSSGRNCFKCGTAGHWSKDCTVPSDQWLPDWREKAKKAYEDYEARKQQKEAGTTTTGDAAAGDESQQAAARDAERRQRMAMRKQKRPNLEATEHLLGYDKQFGLNYVLDNFGMQMRKRFRGRGHEASDLNKLISLYGAPCVIAIRM